MQDIDTKNAKGNPEINSGCAYSDPGPMTAFAIFDISYGAAAVSLFAHLHGVFVDSLVTVENADDSSGDKLVSVTFKSLGNLSRLATHAANLVPHAAFFLIQNKTASVTEFCAHLLEDKHTAFEVDLCGNSVEFRRAARLALTVMRENHDLWRDKADDAWSYWATRLGFDPDDLSFLDPDEDDDANDDAAEDRGLLKPRRVLH